MPIIAVVNDDHNALTSISTVLKAEGFRVATYTDGASALDGFRSAPPDLAILDSKMPRMDGMEMLRRLRAKSDLPVIFLTSQKEAADELFALQMGADDFIRKPVSQHLLVARVKAVLRRASLNGGTLAKKATNNVLECGSLRMDPECHTCTWKHRRVKLTATEFLILHALASRPGVVKSRNELMDVAYGDPLNTDERNVDSHIKRMRRKFTASDSQFNIIESMYGVGYRCKEP